MSCQSTGLLCGVQDEKAVKRSAGRRCRTEHRNCHSFLPFLFAPSFCIQRRRSSLTAAVGAAPASVPVSCQIRFQRLGPLLQGNFQALIGPLQSKTATCPAISSSHTPRAWALESTGLQCSSLFPHSNAVRETKALSSVQL